MIACLLMQLVDVKVCAVDAIYAGRKPMIRKSMRHSEERHDLG
jgi:hypothetical protein